MLIDSFAPTPDASEFHSIEIAATAESVYEALWKADIGDSWITRSLMTLRSLPKRLAGRVAESSAPALNLHTLMSAGFGKLAEEPGREIVIGVSGRFWRPVDNLLPFRLEDFRGAVAHGTARGVWNFHVTETSPGHTLLTTETRVVCGDASSRRKFLAYWMLIRPFSGLIRIVMLRRIARCCERSSAAR